MRYIIIRPLEIILETLFCSIDKLVHDPGLTLVIVSILLNILLLPLYASAERLSSREQEKQKKTERYRKMIDRGFRGDERLMMQNYYYKLAGYHPLSSLKTLLPLMLQVPFFIAAYVFFSNLHILEDASFLCFHGLTAPDGLLSVAGQKINILPILMTVINIVAGALYTRGTQLWQKVQVYLLAVVFLILLYASPSGLVIYWTINNLFSLGRNLIALFRKKPATAEGGERKKRAKAEWGVFLLAGLNTAVFLGLVIPVGLLSSEPSSFTLGISEYQPEHYVWVTFAICLGFLLWGAVLYYTASDRARRIFRYLELSIAVMCWVDYFLFLYEGGSLSPVLNFISPAETIPPLRMFFNLFLLLAFFALVIALAIRFPAFTKSVLVISLLTLLLFSARDIAAIRKGMAETEAQLERVNEQERSYTLSRTGKNVMVIMLDRAVSRYVPYIFAEDPRILEQFDGFTWYPNTASLGLLTNYAAPALFGGYDYSPAAINARKDEKLVDKHNEAMKVLPSVFSSAGWRVTATDIPYGNYHALGDMSIYDGMEGVNAFNLSYFLPNETYGPKVVEAIERNLFYFSLYRIAPEFLKDYIYDEGAYLSAEGQVQYLNPSLMNNYDALEALDDIARITDEDCNTFLMMSNCTTHEPMVLNPPDYTLGAAGASIDSLPESISCGGLECNFGNAFSRIYCTGHYHVNMLAFKTLGKLFDYMRREGVYDNTRIILVADHGWNLYQFEDMLFYYGEEKFDIEAINPLLMVKDFGSREVGTDYTFMSNADTPTLATAGLIDSPVNPYTGNPIDSSPKEQGVEIILGQITDIIRVNNGNTFLPENCPWLKVNNNIFDPNEYTVFSR
ncbi:MAG: membrane protein insertase YidC [Lachnospiraceae bacterium]|nr:membrane protein insertase YidC [Lachnospiraceae bacterium]